MRSWEVPLLTSLARAPLSSESRPCSVKFYEGLSKKYKTRQTYKSDLLIRYVRLSYPNNLAGTPTPPIPDQVPCVRELSGRIGRRHHRHGLGKNAGKPAT